MEWTEQEIERAAQRHYEYKCVFEQITWGELSDWQRRKLCYDIRAALSANPRIPEGHWLAPDEADAEMIGAMIGWREKDSRAGLSFEADMFDRAYACARDAVKGKADD